MDENPRFAKVEKEFVQNYKYNPGVATIVGLATIVVAAMLSATKARGNAVESHDDVNDVEGSVQKEIEVPKDIVSTGGDVLFGKSENFQERAEVQVAKNDSGSRSCKRFENRVARLENSKMIRKIVSSSSVTEGCMRY
jgi:hypothetical protein